MGKLVDVTITDEQLEGTESTLSQWFVAEGDAVEANAPLLELNTDKVSVEIAAPAAGVVREHLKRVDDPIVPGDVVGRIETTKSGAQTTSLRQPAKVPAAAASGRSTPSPATAVASSLAARELRLSPAVRRLLKQHRCDPAAIAGTGRGGRVTYRDALAFVETKSPGSGQMEHPLRKSTVPAGPVPSRLVPHTMMRSSIARHMVESALETAPHVTAVFEADMSAVLAHRQAHKGTLAEAGIRLTLTAYLVQAACTALRAVPEVNGRWHDDALELYDQCNVGIATALEPEGLIVPVIHGAERLDLADTAARLGDLASRARTGRLSPKEVQGGTFTITNHGVSGSLIATPIINQPQSAILGVGKLQKRVMVVEHEGGDAIQIRPMVYVTLTIDHRALDGFKANAFLTQLVGRLESWS